MGMLKGAYRAEEVFNGSRRDARGIFGEVLPGSGIDASWMRNGCKLDQ